MDNHSAGVKTMVTHFAIWSIVMMLVYREYLVFLIPPSTVSPPPLGCLKSVNVHCHAEHLCEGGLGHLRPIEMLEMKLLNFKEDNLQSEDQQRLPIYPQVIKRKKMSPKVIRLRPIRQMHNHDNDQEEFIEEPPKQQVPGFEQNIIKQHGPEFEQEVLKQVEQRKKEEEQKEKMRLEEKRKQEEAEKNPGYEAAEENNNDKKQEAERNWTKGRPKYNENYDVEEVLTILEYADDNGCIIEVEYVYYRQIPKPTD